ncbi:MAG: hypothetical protein Q9174_006365 [Haloplaca sp. 1 TL-2023]
MLQRTTLNPGLRQRVQGDRHAEDLAAASRPEPPPQVLLQAHMGKVRSLKAQLQTIESVRERLGPYIAKHPEKREELQSSQEILESRRKKQLLELRHLRTCEIPKFSQLVDMQEAHPGKRVAEIQKHYDEESQWALLMPENQRGGENKEKMAPTDRPEPVFNTLYNLSQDRFCEMCEDDPVGFIDKILREHCED